jgi:hypothetical protein
MDPPAMAKCCSIIAALLYPRVKGDVVVVFRCNGVIVGAVCRSCVCEAPFGVGIYKL